MYPLKQNIILKSALGGLSVAALLFLQACTDGKGESNPIPKISDPIPVRLMEVKKTTSDATVIVSGQLTTEDEAVLGFKIGGVVAAVTVNEGDAIRKGQLLATLDLTEIDAGLSQARLGVEKAERDFKRAQNLYRDSVATLEQLQNSETALKLASEQLKSVTFNKSHAAIFATDNGTVLQKFANKGTVVGIGDPVLMVNKVTAGDWILKVGVSDRQWAAIENGDRADVRIDAFPGEAFQAAVLRKSATSDPRSGAFTVELRLRNPGVRLASGMFGSATIHAGAPSAAWSVPYESVLDADDNEGFVFVTTDNKTAIKRPVTIEAFNEKEIVITKGLDDHTRLIVSGSAYLTDKSPIKVIE
ncbi:MAG: efflux RND transporter periplasmic adaptor subunit [Bacteroidia bacterium]|nr:efflux RND transporter periplasmic adaptor subunit [Bacteroidia bacterium]